MTCNGDNETLTVSYIMLTRSRILSISYVRGLYFISPGAFSGLGVLISSSLASILGAGRTGQ